MRGKGQRLESPACEAQPRSTAYTSEGILLTFHFGPLALITCRLEEDLNGYGYGYVTCRLEEDLKYFQNTKALPRDLMWEIDRIHMRNRLPIFSSTRVGRDWDMGAYGEGEIGEIIP